MVRLGLRRQAAVKGKTQINSARECIPCFYDSLKNIFKKEQRKEGKWKKSVKTEINNRKVKSCGYSCAQTRLFSVTCFSSPNQTRRRQFDRSSKAKDMCKTTPWSFANILGITEIMGTIFFSLSRFDSPEA
ncbi:hypothetical protein EVAR_73546_1 [Eumeta japonica]|uniref:Uncharacterized protein n=1 Tax=Eumeta variegata TaxID=151549 RepID=A0A4C1SS81_EUMVA|nr:hypothetical protein EVAR_73546_1 [Eumeta japonica]